MVSVLLWMEFKRGKTAVIVVAGDRQVNVTETQLGTRHGVICQTPEMRCHDITALVYQCRQCFDAAGLVAGRASGL